MKERITRRRFVARSCSCLAGLGAAGCVGSAWAKEPGKSTLAVGCRDAHLKLLGAEDCWSALRLVGGDSLEAVIGEDLSFPGLFHPQRKYSAATQAGIDELAADMRSAGVRISALCMFNRFDERPEFEVDWGTKAAGVAQALGVKAIRIDLRRQKSSEAEFLDSSIRVLKKLMVATESTGVAFGIENHGNTTNDPQFLTPLFDGVGSNRLGLTLDTGNFYWFGHPLSKLYEIYETFAPRVVHVHAKNINYPASERERRRPMGWKYTEYNCPVYEGDIDFARVVKILRNAGYANDLCVEDEGLRKVPDQRRASVLAKEIRYLRGLL